MINEPSRGHGREHAVRRLVHESGLREIGSVVGRGRWRRHGARAVIGERWEARTRTPIYRAGDGLTETQRSPRSTRYRRSGSERRADSRHDVRLVDQRWPRRGTGSGRVWVKGAAGDAGIGRGRRNGASSDGCVATGDVAEDGRRRLPQMRRSRRTDLVSGFNVYPNEVEGGDRHTSRSGRTAVVGVRTMKRRDRRGVVTAKDESSPKSHPRHCKQSMTGYKVPKCPCSEGLAQVHVGRSEKRSAEEAQQPSCREGQACRAEADVGSGGG